MALEKIKLDVNYYQIIHISKKIIFFNILRLHTTVVKL